MRLVAAVSKWFAFFFLDIKLRKTMGELGISQSVARWLDLEGSVRPSEVDWTGSPVLLAY